MFKSSDCVTISRVGDSCVACKIRTTAKTI